MRILFFAVMLALATPAAASQPFKCTLQGDGRTVRVTIANPFQQDAQCMVDCQFATNRAGTSFMVSCGKAVPPGEDVELCVKTYDKGTLTAMTGGTGECTDPTPRDTPADDDDDDEALIQRLQQQGQDMLKKMKPAR